MHCNVLKITLGVSDFNISTFTGLIDNGYHNGGEIHFFKDKTITTICASYEIVNSNLYAEAVEENNKRYHLNQKLYRKRQEINEHIFGTIKRKWGYNYTNLKGLEKVNGEPRRARDLQINKLNMGATGFYNDRIQLQTMYEYTWN